jgi:hypothetical protein
LKLGLVEALATALGEARLRLLQGRSAAGRVCLRVRAGRGAT